MTVDTTNRSRMRGVRYAEQGNLAKFYGSEIHPDLTGKVIYAARERYGLGPKPILGIGMGPNRLPVLHGAEPAYFDRVPDELADAVEEYVRGRTGWETAVLLQRPENERLRIWRELSQPPRQSYRPPQREGEESPDGRSDLEDGYLPEEEKEPTEVRRPWWRPKFL